LNSTHNHNKISRSKGRLFFIHNNHFKAQRSGFEVKRQNNAIGQKAALYLRAAFDLMVLFWISLS